MGGFLERVVRKGSVRRDIPRQPREEPRKSIPGGSSNMGSLYTDTCLHMSKGASTTGARCGRESTFDNALRDYPRARSGRIW